MGNENGKVEHAHNLPSKLNLIKSAQDHFTLIQELNFKPHYFHPKVVDYAIFRYQNYWLPFAAKHLDKILVAPVDIELIWVVHILDRDAYQRDCLKIANQLIPHTPIPFQWRLNNEATTKAWDAEFGEKVALNIDSKIYPETIPPYNSIVSINLREAVEQYRSFTRQVSLPHFKDPKFLQVAFYSYLQEAVNAGKETFPRTDLEFLWRTHKLTPTAYNVDGNALRETFGTQVRDNHSIRNQRKGAGSYDVMPANQIRGAMYRGNAARLVSMVNKQKLEALAHKTLTFHIMGYRLGNLMPGKNYRLLIRTKSLLTQKETNVQSFRVKGDGTTVFQTFPDKSEETTVSYNSAIADVVKIRLSQINMMNSSISLSENVCDQFNFDFDFFNCDGITVGKETKLEISIPTKGRRSEDEELSWVRLRCDAIEMGVINLFFAIKQSSIYKADQFCSVLSLPIMMAPYFTKRKKAPCIYTSRALKDRRNETIFKCRILKTLSAEFFSIEVLDFNEKLICSSYTIGKEALPAEDQVWKPETCCVLRDNMETVFAIRSTNAEWGLLKVFHMKTKENHVVPTQILFLCLKDVELHWVNLYDKDNDIRIINYKWRGHRLSVDLNLGRLQIPPGVQEFPELLSLGVNVLALFHCFPYKDTLGL